MAEKKPAKKGTQKPAKTRYATLGFSDNAALDEGYMWPNGFALMKLTAAEEKDRRAREKSGGALDKITATWRSAPGRCRSSRGCARRSS
jgi:hypothetical protein